MTKPEFDQQVIELQKAFQTEYSPLELKVLWGCVKKMDVIRLQKAIETCVETVKRRPFIAQVLENLPPAPSNGTVLHRPSGEDTRRFIRELYRSLGQKQLPHEGGVKGKTIATKLSGRGEGG